MRMKAAESTPLAEKLLEGLLKQLTPASWWFAREEIAPEAFKQLLHEVTTVGAGLACKHLHDNSCSINMALKGFRMLLRVYKMYALIHLVPHCLFKKDRFSRKSLTRLVLNILRTLVFFQAYASIGMYGYCGVSRLFSGKISFLAPMILAPLGAVMILIERSHRWPEFAMNIFPKYLESVEPFLRARRLWVDLPLGTHLLFSLSMGAVSSVYFTDTEAIKKTFRWLVAAVMGPAEEERGLPTKHASEEYK